jgi:hypothetical protein
MRPRLSKLDRKHPEAARDAMEDIKDFAGDPRPVRNEIKYVRANRDRALGESDRTGRHYDHDGKAAVKRRTKASRPPQITKRTDIHCPRATLHTHRDRCVDWIHRLWGRRSAIDISTADSVFTGRSHDR